jgi:hypothetical protein
MRLIREFDRSTWLLLTISLLGMFFSIYGLFFSPASDTDSQQGQEIVAKILWSTADTRLKRAGNLHWFKVDQSATAYDNDLVFTGSDSAALIEFPSGDKIHLLPNSMVMVNKGVVSLEKGDIEVEVVSKQPVQVAAMGKVVSVSKKSRVNLSNVGGEIQVSPIKVLTRVPPRLKKLVRSNELKILEPVSGQIFPAFENYLIPFRWESSIEEEVILDIAGKKFRTKDTGFVLKVEELPAGMISWKIKSGDLQKESFFYVLKDLDIQLKFPNQGERILTPKKQLAEIHFVWASKLRDWPKRIQVSNEPSFHFMIVDENVSGESIRKSLAEGTYFWRIGLRKKGNDFAWSSPLSFEVDKVPPVVIGIRHVPELWDFVLSKSLVLEVFASEPIQRLTYRLDGPEGVNGMVRDMKIEFSYLKDGDYKIKVFDKSKDEVVESEEYFFKVRNSKPLKINKSQSELFVLAPFLSEDFFEAGL